MHEKNHFTFVDNDLDEKKISEIPPGKGIVDEIRVHDS